MKFNRVRTLEDITTHPRTWEDAQESGFFARPVLRDLALIAQRAVVCGPDESGRMEPFNIMMAAGNELTDLNGLYFHIRPREECPRFNRCDGCPNR